MHACAVGPRADLHTPGSAVPWLSVCRSGPQDKWSLCGEQFVHRQADWKLMGYHRGVSESGGCTFPHPGLMTCPGPPRGRWWSWISQVVRPFGCFPRIWASGEGCVGMGGGVGVGFSSLGQGDRAFRVCETAVKLKAFPGDRVELRLRGGGGTALAETGLSAPRPAGPLQGAGCFVLQGQSQSEVRAARRHVSSGHSRPPRALRTFKSYFRSSSTSDSL